MGKYTFRGLKTSLEGVPQIQTFLTGKNLPGPSKKYSEQPKPEQPVPEQETPTNGEEEVKP